MLNNTWVRFTVLFCVIFIPLFMFSMQSMNDVKQKKRDAAIEQKLLEIAKEVKRRQSDKGNSNTPNSVNQSKENVSTLAELDNTSDQSMDGTPPQKISGNTSENIVMEGPHKGMTQEELQKHLDLKERKRALDARSDKHSEDILAIAEIQLQSSRDERSLILSLFKNLDPKLLEETRKAFLKTYPAEDVNSFFDDLANHPTAVTPAQFTKSDTA